jgi:hypothetical protein
MDDRSLEGFPTHTFSALSSIKQQRENVTGVEQRNLAQAPAERNTTLVAPSPVLSRGLLGIFTSAEECAVA